MIEDHKFERVRLNALKPNKRNARKHTEKQYNLLKESITRFGFTSVLVVDDDNNILAGNGRYEAAKRLGMEALPVRRLSNMSEAERRAYAISDNRLAEIASWDFEILTDDLRFVAEDGLLDLTGYEQAQFDALVEEAVEASTKEPHKSKLDDIPPVQASAIAQLGDLFQLGNHRIICGDGRDEEVLAKLMGDDVATACFTDPPYNVPIAGHVLTQDKSGHGNFAFASGEMSSDQFTVFLTTALRNIAKHLRDGGIAYCCMDWRHFREALDAGNAAFSEFKNLCVWVKTNAGMGTFYRSKHELILVFKRGTAPHINNFGLGDGGRHRTNVWTYPGVNTFKAERDEELAAHPTVKPVALVQDALRDVTNRGDIVLDTFGGSGTTLIAAHKVGRKARLVEYEPKYVDVTIRRWEKLTGKSAIHVASGTTFEQLAANRSGWTTGAGAVS